MTIPAILFGLVVAFLAGALFHVLRGGGGWRLLLNLALSTLGFVLGHASAVIFGFFLYQFGVLDIGSGVVGSLVVLLVGDWLSRIRPDNKSSV